MSLDIGGDGTAFATVRSRGMALAKPRAGSLLFVALFVFALLPVLTTPIPAMVDYVNHLSRMYLLAAAGTPAASRFYLVKWTLTPDLAMDLIVPRLAHWLGVEAATRLFLLVSQVLVVTGAMAIEAAVKRRLEISGVMALLTLYCAPFAWGFLNFEFALGLALWGVAIWLALRERPWALRFCSHALVVALLFVSHLFALGLYGFTLGVHEAWSAWRQRATAREILATILTLAAPAVALLGLMAVSGGSVGEAGNSWHMLTKPFLIFAILNGYNLVLSTVEMLILLVLAHALWKRGALRFVASGSWMAIGMVALYIAVPSLLRGTALVDVRVVAAALLIVPAFVTVAFPSEGWRRGVTGAVAALVLVNAGLTTFVWQSYQPDYRALIGSFARLGAGAHVLVGRAGREDADPPFLDLTEYPMFHAPTLAAPLAGAFVPTLFTTVGKQPLEVRATDRRLSYSCGGPILTSILKAIAEGRAPADAPEFVRTWPRDFDYLYVVGAAEANPMPDRLEALETHRRFTLYRVRKEAAALTSRQPAAGSPRRPAG
jgi:hypothetical protein